MESAGFIARLAKVDFADALGVVVSDDAVSVAHLTKRFNRVRVADVSTERLEGPPEVRGPEAATFLKDYAERASLEGARVSVVVERQATFLGSLLLPAAASSNVASVVELELDRIIPVPSDDLMVDYYERPMGSAGERIAVTVVAALAERVSEALGWLEGSELGAAAATVEPVALADYYRFCSAEGEDLAGLFTEAGGRQYLTLCADGAMASSHHSAVTDGEYAAVVAQEIESALPERCGDTPVVLAGLPVGDSCVSLASIAPEGFFPPGVEPSVAEIVAIGAALGQLGESRAEVNVLPDSMVKAREGLGLRELALSAALVTTALVLAGTIALKNLSIESALASELDRLTPLVTEVADVEENNQKLQGKLLKLEKSSRSNVLVYLREVTELVPDSAYLTTFRYRGERIELDGIADEASVLISILENSQYFADVAFTAPTTKYLADQERFSLRMKLER